MPTCPLTLSCVCTLALSSLTPEVRCFYDPGYVFPLPEEHPFPMDKFWRAEAMIRSAGVPGLSIHGLEPASFEQLLRVHTPEYLEQIRTGALDHVAALKLGLVVEGLSFHVGSQCTNFENYVQALNTAAAGLPFAAKSGTFFVDVKDAAGSVVRTQIHIDLDGLNGNDTTLNSLAADINASATDSA